MGEDRGGNGSAGDAKGTPASSRDIVSCMAECEFTQGEALERTCFDESPSLCSFSDLESDSPPLTSPTLPDLGATSPTADETDAPLGGTTYDFGRTAVPESSTPESSIGGRR